MSWSEQTGRPADADLTDQVFGGQPRAVADPVADESLFGDADRLVISRRSGVTQRVTPDEIIDVGDIVAAIGKYHGKGAANGVGLNAAFVHVWRFGPDGKITGSRTHTDTYLWRQALGPGRTRG